MKGFDVTDKLFHGVIPALITPFLPGDGGINVPAVKPMVDYFIECGVNGFYVCGNTGEGFTQTLDERKTMLEATVAAVGGRVPILVHVGAVSTEDACILAEHAKKVGANATSSVVPTELPDTLDEALDATAKHFKAIGKASGGLPFYIYWYFGTSAVKGVTAEQYLDHMKDVPNLAGLKYTSKDFYLMARISALRPDLNILSGCDEMNLSAKVIGAHGAIGSTYHVHPKTYVRMQKAFDAGDLAKAKELQYFANANISKLIDVCDCASRGTNIVAGIKAILRHKGFTVGYPRAQAATPLTGEQEDDLIAYFTNNNIE